jgi:hypothetical protein
MHRYILYPLHDFPYLFITSGTWINGPYFHSASWKDLQAEKEMDCDTDREEAGMDE